MIRLCAFCNSGLPAAAPMLLAKYRVFWIPDQVRNQKQRDSGLFVYFGAIGDAHDQYDQLGILDPAYDSMIPNPVSPELMQATF